LFEKLALRFLVLALVIDFSLSAFLGELSHHRIRSYPTCAVEKTDSKLLVLDTHFLEPLIPLQWISHSGYARQKIKTTVIIFGEMQIAHLRFRTKFRMKK
jgi:hypothetical protein